MFCTSNRIIYWKNKSNRIKSLNSNGFWNSEPAKHKLFNWVCCFHRSFFVYLCSSRSIALIGVTIITQEESLLLVGEENRSSTLTHGHSMPLSGYRCVQKTRIVWYWSSTFSVESEKHSAPPEGPQDTPSFRS